MDNNSNYFYIGGFVSISLFAVFCLLFAFALFDPNKVNTFAMQKDSYVSISLETIPVKTQKPKKNITTQAQESVSETQSEDIDVNDLFSDVWTKKIVEKKEKPVNSKRIQEIQKKLKSVESKSTKANKSEEKNFDVNENSQESKSTSTANEVNEYLAKIQAIVYRYFNVPANSQGSSVKTVIELNALGQLVDFRVLTYSQNSALNAEADKIKERLRNVIFPLNPEKKSSKTIVILIAKE